MHCVDLALLSTSDFGVPLRCEEFSVHSWESLCWEKSNLLKPRLGVAELNVAVLEYTEGFQAKKIDFAQEIIVALLYSASHF